MKWWKKDVQRIVYSRCSPFSWTVFLPYAVRRICIEVAVSLTNTKEFFVEKKKFPVVNMLAWKLTANNEQCIAAHSPCFREEYFIQQKKSFVLYSSCSQIVYNGLNINTWKILLLAKSRFLKNIATWKILILKKYWYGKSKY